MRINIGSRAKVEKALQEAQGKATARVVEVEDIHRIAKRADEALEGASLSERRGTQAHYCEHAYGPNAYANKRFRGPSTFVVLERGARDWFLVEAERVDAPTIVGNRNVDLTIKTKESAITAALEAVRRDRRLETLAE